MADGQLVDLKIGQVVSALELFGTAHTRGADIDAGDLSFGPTQGMLGCLRRSAAGDENGKVLPVGSVRPKEVVISTPPLRVFPEPIIFFKAIDWPRIGITVV